MSLQTNFHNCFNTNDPDTLLNTWNTINCGIVTDSIINSPNDIFTNTGDVDDPYKFNKKNFDYIQGTSVPNLFKWYTDNYTITNNVSDPKWNPFQEQLLHFCLERNTPGVCDVAMKNFCKYSRKDILNSSTLVNFCGCYVPPDPEDIKYTLGTLQCLTGTTQSTGSNQCEACNEVGPNCQPVPACDSLCNRTLTIQGYYETATGVNQTICPQNVCVINGVTITSDSSNVPGGINFNNQCMGCGVGNVGCRCVISGVNLTNTISKIGIGSNFNQVCGSNSTCIQYDQNGKATSGQCNIDLTQFQPKVSTYVQSNMIIIV